MAAPTTRDGPQQHEKIEALKHRLPAALVQYKSVYVVLSVGIHMLDEKTCLSYFPVVRAIIMLILENHLETRNKKLAQENLAKAFSSINAKVKQEKNKS